MKKQIDNSKIQTERSITRSVGETTAAELMWLTGLRAPFLTLRNS